MMDFGSTRVYAAFGRWILAVILSFTAFDRSGREIVVDRKMSLTN